MIWLNGFLAAFALLTVFKAPAKPFWYAAIVATEAGHWLAIVSVFAVLIAWWLTRRWTIACSLAFLALVLFLTPLARSILVARKLPSHLSTVFGNPVLRTNPSAPVRSHPLTLWDLIRGIHSPAVQVKTLEYAQPDGQPLALDLYRPLSLTKALPLVVIIHGGSWQSGDRKEFIAFNHYLAARGYAVASLDYRFAPRWIFPAQRDDVFAALAYLKKRSKELELDMNHVVLMGRSAGGQIALSAAYARKEPGIKGVIAFYTPSDLLWGYSVPANPLVFNSRKVLKTYLSGSPEQVAGRYEAASPVFQVNRQTPPTLMIHGGRDELVSPLHNVRLSERLAQAGRPYFFLRLPWATHGCDAYMNGPSGQLSLYTVERFLAAVLPEEGA